MFEPETDIEFMKIVIAMEYKMLKILVDNKEEEELTASEIFFADYFVSDSGSVSWQNDNI